ESRRAEVLQPVELPVEPSPVPTPAAPAPRKPEVAIGTFANAPAPVQTPEPARQLEIAGFDRTQKQTIETKPSTTAVVAFDRQAVSGPPKGGPSQNGAGSSQNIENVVADAGFNRSAVVMSAAPEGKVVRDTGFGPLTSLRAS